MSEQQTKVRKACGLYLRVSTEMQASVRDGSLDTQFSTLSKYVDIKTANSEEEWYVADVYREEGKSGKNTDRDEYQRMIADIKAGKLNVLLCTKIDRVHRSLMDFYRLHELLESHNVDFVSLSENWDTSTPMGRFGLKLTLAVAELEREQTAQRTREKMQWRAEEGLWNGGQVLGYDIDPDSPGELKVNDAEAKIVRDIFMTYLDVRSFREATRQINAKGYRSKAYVSRRGNQHGGRKLTKTGLIHVVSNPVYIGKVTHNGDIFEGKHQAIIDEGLWRQAQELVSRNRVLRKKPRRQKKHSFLLEGLVRCGSCGAYMTPTYSTGKAGKVYFYYQCTTLNNGTDSCEMGRVSAGALEDLVAERLLRMACDEGLVASILRETENQTSEERRILEEQRDLQKRALAPVEQEIRNIVKFVAQGKASPALAEELEGLEVRRKQIQGELDRIEQEAQGLDKRTLNARVVQEGLDLFGKIWEAAEPEERKELMRLFVHRLIYTPSEVRLGLHTEILHVAHSARPEGVKPGGRGAVSWQDWLPKCARLRTGLVTRGQRPISE